MRSGPLNRRVTIQQSSTTSRDSGGGVVEAWTNYTTGWASVEPLNGRELFDAQQKYGEVSHRIRLMHDRGLMFGVRPAYRVLVPRLNSAVGTATTSTSGTSLVLDGTNVSALPPVPFRVRVNDEFMEVTAVSSNTLTVSRGEYGSAATTHSTGDVVQTEVVMNVEVVFSPKEANDELVVFASEVF